MLVPCEACRRHLRPGDVVCPFCKVTRTSSKLVAVALSSAIVLAGCDTFSGGAKYGGPPPGAKTDPSAPSASATSPSSAEPATSSPRIDGAVPLK